MQQNGWIGGNLSIATKMLNGWNVWGKVSMDEDELKWDGDNKDL